MVKRRRSVGAATSGSSLWRGSGVLGTAGSAKAAPILVGTKNRNQPDPQSGISMACLQSRGRSRGLRSCGMLEAS